jgi:ABC-2 type transport system ATP-binding protein
MNSSLVISNLSKSYKKLMALDSVSIEMGSGVWGILGPNGAGKTTLFRILATVMKQDSGSIAFGDISWVKPQFVRSLIGYVPQQFGLYPLVSVEEALEHIATMKRIPQQQVSGEVDRILDCVNLSEHRKKRIQQLSGGMMRRLAIAQAILGDPKILIMDEPTAGLDPEERIRFRTIVRQIQGDKIILISSHIVNEIESLCQNIAIIKEGKIIVSGSISYIQEQAANKARGELSEPSTVLSLEDAYMFFIRGKMIYEE